MHKNHNYVTIIAVVIVLALILWYSSTRNQVENFDNSPYQSARELNKFYEGSTKGIRNDLVDNMTCHPSCCGDQWPTPFDGLTGPEVERCIENRGVPGPFVRTNYTCANGINGVGCPCIDRQAYLFLVNHGTDQAQTMSNIEPSFLIRNDAGPSPYEEGPYQQLIGKKSIFVDTPKINDLELQREPMPVNDVQSHGATLPHSLAELNNYYPVN
jgi:hypothetical protein